MTQPFSKGQKGKLTDMGLNGLFTVTVEVSGPGVPSQLNSSGSKLACLFSYNGSNGTVA